MIRNRWMFVYMGFFLLLTTALFLLSNDMTKVIVSLNNFILYLTPLVGILFGSMYYYNSEEFLELLLAQPISRKAIIAGLYLGMAASLSLSLIIGIGLPMMIFGSVAGSGLSSILLLLVISIILSIIFSLLSFIIASKNKNRIRGFGISIFAWLFFAIIYDGLFLLLLLVFKEYPLEKATLGMIIFNPIDLSRILLLMKLDASAIMGYTGAVLQKFLGSNMGYVFILTTQALWITLLSYFMIRISKRKDF